jgi:diguanylate cyclase (GGDEF)-like protein
VDLALRFEAFRAALSPAHGLFLLVFVVVMIYARVLMGRVEASRLHAERAMHRDPLTGLLNRRGFELEAERILTDPACGSRCTLLFADLDGFKSVNDDLGHAAGDQVLRRVAAILTDTARTDDICGRYGGDEFVLLCPGISRHDGVRIGERLRDAVVQWANTEGCRLSLSIGIGEAPEHGVSVEQLMARVDAAMYAGRREDGRGSIRVIATDGAPA